MSENVKGQVEAPSENSMWESPETKSSQKMTAQEINEKYVLGEQRIITESNREKLPNFVEALHKHDYMDLRPFYQRRPRWDAERQSRLIESFIINVPVPPVFLYEKNYNSYEVMDGQQRITAIRDFYDNTLKLKGLELWPELNGMTYKELPSKIKAGIDRRSIASIVLLKESAPDDEKAILLRQLVFERLNTGGVKLEKQEIRNALYQGKVNNLLLKLSRSDLFRQAWSLPLFSEDEEQNQSSPIYKHPLFQKMEDLEIILRFFALRHAEHYKLGMQGFLDLYMVKSRSFNDNDISILENTYSKTISLTHSIFGDLMFKPFDPVNGSWTDTPKKAFYDAVMVSLSKFLDNSETLIKKREQIMEETKELFKRHDPGTFTGRGNSKKDVEERINLFTEMLSKVLAA
jgi:hypothetical protein